MTTSNALLIFNFMIFINPMQDNGTTKMGKNHFKYVGMYIKVMREIADRTINHSSKLLICLNTKYKRPPTAGIINTPIYLI